MTEEDKQDIAQMMSKKKKGLSKYSTLILVSSIFLIGVIASFEGSPIIIDKYVKFLGEFKIILSVLIGSVGAGLAVKNFKGKKSD